jgi:acetoacetyl-CoA synthetase
MPELRAGDEVWSPNSDLVHNSAMARFRDEAARARGFQGHTYQDLWGWSVEDVGRFWRALIEFENVIIDKTPAVALEGDGVEDARWFRGAQLNFAEHVFRDRDDSGVALICVDENGTREVTWGDLADRVANLAQTLTRFGVEAGDRVAGYLSNTESAVVGFLACASIGAVWTVCSPDLGVDGVVSRFAPLTPTVLIAVDGYRYGGTEFDRHENVAAILDGLSSVRHLIWDNRIGSRTPDVPVETVLWPAAIEGDAPLSFARVEFSHPLWVLFSSGTTGSPKGIVHGHGGSLLEQLKQHHLHFDERAGDRFLYLGSTSWMVWNLMVSALLCGTSIVLVDGNPLYPSVGRPFEIAATHRVTQLGVGAGYVHAAIKAGLKPNSSYDLSALRNISVTGSPLSLQGFEWLSDNMPAGTWPSPASGGTDICSAFVGGSPLVPALAGRFQAIGLGVALQAWDESGHAVVGERGELVITRPMPSMPLYLYGDTDGGRLHESYFSTFDGVWRHGDFITVYPDGTSVIHGRSDATLNRQGVRIGPADISSVAEQLPWVTETLIIGAEADDDYRILMFVHTVEDASAPERSTELRSLIRSRLSPRHVPDEIFFVPAIPHTRTGKKLEVPIKRLFQGEPLDKVLDLSAADSPEAVLAFASLAGDWRRRAESR